MARLAWDGRLGYGIYLIRETVQRALDYAHSNGVTLVAAAGNQHLDMANPGTDLTRPDFPAGATHSRTIDNDSCLSLPSEGRHVLGVTALGPSERKSDFSNWTTEPGAGEVELSAPGGWFRDGFGTPSHRTNQNLILSTYPLKALQDEGSVDPAGNITPQGESLGVIKQCQSSPAPGTSPCGYYAWPQGTSMASPHTAGVAALAVSSHGRNQGRSRFGMNPDAVRRTLLRSATDHACPADGVQEYLAEGQDATWTATCEGGAARNGFYGEGIVNAWAAIR